MRDVIWTIIVTWVIWKIWSMFKSARTVVVQKNEQHNHHHHYHNQPEGTTTVNTQTASRNKSFKDDDGEYIDFEEVKK